MSNLENMKASIMKDAQKEADEILARARKQVDKERAEALEQAEEEAALIAERAKRELPQIEDRIQAEVEHEDRLKQLGAKQDMVQEVFRIAREKLVSLDADAYREAIERYLQAHPLEEDAVLEIPEGMEISLPQTQIEYVKTIRSGFRIRRGGIRDNFDFLDVLEYLKSTLEQEVMAAIVKGDA